MLYRKYAVPKTPRDYPLPFWESTEALGSQIAMKKRHGAGSWGEMPGDSVLAPSRRSAAVPGGLAPKTSAKLGRCRYTTDG